MSIASDDDAQRDEVVQRLEQVLADVRVAVQDWRAMLARVGEVIADMKANPPPLPPEETAEAVEFLEWLVADNFTLARRARLSVRRIRPASRSRCTGSGLGVLRSPETRELGRGGGEAVMAREMRAYFNEPTALMITKASMRSRVHRRVFMDYVSVKRFDANGDACRRIPHRRTVHLDRLYALDPLDPVSAAQGRCAAQARALQPVRAFRQGAGQSCWRPIRATTCSASTTTRSISSRC